MAQFMLELFGEELPVSMQQPIAEQVRGLATAALAEAGLTHGAVHLAWTPRRLVLAIDDVPEREPKRVEERRGPRVGAPEAALQGFLKGAGLASIAAAEQRDTGKGIFYFATQTVEGRPAAVFLPALVERVVRALSWPKSMRWGRGGESWGRPLGSFHATLDGVRIGPESLGFGGDVSVPNRPSPGHRFHSPAPVEAASFAALNDALLTAHVILDAGRRKQTIRAQIEALAATHGYTVEPDEALLDEVTGLVEWPHALLGRIDPAFMDLPVELRRATMRANQRYFTLYRSDGAPAPAFIVVANIQPADGGATIVRGNERVLRARLSDAAFYWNGDVAVPLEERVALLERIRFHPALGDMRQRAERLESLARVLAKALGEDAATAACAARLAKTDLTTGVVREFPELQGFVGRRFAQAQGLPAAIALTLAEHWQPRGASDPLPSLGLPTIVALADRIDQLVGFFAIGQAPTGSRDPFSLRRAALGLVRMLRDRALLLQLAPLLLEAWSGYKRQGLIPEADAEQVTAQLGAFLAERVQFLLREDGVRIDIVRAAAAAARADEPVPLQVARTQALAAMLGSEAGAALTGALRRAGNIVAIEAKRDGADIYPPPTAAQLHLEEERALAAALDTAEAETAAALAEAAHGGSAENAAAAYGRAMGALARLRQPLDAFFDKVMVNAPEAEIRRARLGLLARLPRAFAPLADIAHLQGA